MHAKGMEHCHNNLCMQRNSCVIAIIVAAWMKNVNVFNFFIANARVFFVNLWNN